MDAKARAIDMINKLFEFQSSNDSMTAMNMVNIAETSIKQARNEALEEAAKVVETTQRDAAQVIRALKDK